MLDLQGPTLLGGFWAAYAREFMPPLEDLTSTLTMSPQELRLLEVRCNQCHRGSRAS